MRLFVGSFLSPRNQEHYGRFAAGICRAHVDVLRPVPDASLHLTHVFVGEAGVEHVDAISAAVERVASLGRAVLLVFGPPRVLWAGRTPRLVELPATSGAMAATRLSAALAAAISEAGGEPGISPARSAHVTLARFRRLARREDGRRVEPALQAGSREELLDRVAVVESTLTSTGPTYRVLAEHRLG